MGKYCQLVIGPAGSGKSTYCNTMRTHCENLKRSVHCVNLDPAADQFQYPVSIDIKELVTVDEVMESEEGFGPNGGLMFAMQYLMENFDWFEEKLEDFDDDYLIIDCPGQIELYTHVELMQKFAQQLDHKGYRVCVVYIIDSHFLGDASKFIAASMMCLSAMVRLELPHINVISKMDLLIREHPEMFGNFDSENGYEEYDRFLNPDFEEIVEELNTSMGKRFAKLNKGIAEMLSQWSLVHFLPLNKEDPDSVTLLLAQIDNATQFGEDEEPQEPKDEDLEEGEEDQDFEERMRETMRQQNDDD